MSAITSEKYRAALRARLEADGCQVTEPELGGMPALVGYRANFALLSRIHVFTVGIVLDRVDMRSLHAVTEVAIRHAHERRGTWRGAQSGLLVLPVLISERVDWDAARLVQDSSVLGADGFAVLTQISIVDVTKPVVHTFRGKRFWGMAYSGLIRKKLAAYLD